ncbi:DUF1836 domain-containing protein [Vagococcus carniphilus]|uniref:DUF1836 domain-containing protein n=1 Tax=Vagococcus carniphilus TaxID=218144 RepID=A0AAW8U4Q6_9ENTE|nr:DUF1836 domain-containing protein [Vagococcus carniphilus]MDT2814410.1 DUF1836 domain-containing protein [Vagococcus carniphilus]MDT2833194.1 DUF1836 domain-containing protein [Vagococcus carniphilus]MDT2864531.1 DUF1836 domain-containing protein [Vagococcus carniphilus]
MNNILEDGNWEPELLAFTLPRWDELPDIEIYMDQLVKIVDKYTQPLLLDHTKALTPSMINNYVKLKLVPKPYKKKYGKNHLARVLVITILKQAFEIPAIRNGIELKIDATNAKEAYNLFCEHLESTITCFLVEENKSVTINEIKRDYDPIQMACTTFIAKLITEKHLDDILKETITTGEK